MPIITSYERSFAIMKVDGQIDLPTFNSIVVCPIIVSGEPFAVTQFFGFFTFSILNDLSLAYRSLMKEVCAPVSKRHLVAFPSMIMLLEVANLDLFESKFDMISIGSFVLIVVDGSDRLFDWRFVVDLSESLPALGPELSSLNCFYYDSPSQNVQVCRTCDILRRFDISQQYDLVSCTFRMFVCSIDFVSTRWSSSSSYSSF